MERDAELLTKLDLLIALTQGLGPRLDRLEARVGTLESRSEERFQQIDGRFQQIDDRFAKIDERFARMESRFNALDVTIAEFRGETRGRLDGLAERITDVNNRLPVPIAYAPPKSAAE